MKSLLIAAAIAATVIAVGPATAQTVTVNSTPGVGWHYGSGNAYVPANTVVETASDGTQLYGRWHVPNSQAPASDANGVYSFALGTSSISFDFGFTAPTAAAFATDLTNASFTLTDLGTGVMASAPLFVFTPDPTAYTGSNSLQDSEQAKFGFLLGSDYDPNRNDTYRVALTAGGNTLNYFAKVGAGVSAVPEPASWAMMILGMGAIGFTMRSAKRRSEKEVRRQDQEDHLRRHRLS